MKIFMYTILSVLAAGLALAEDEPAIIQADQLQKLGIKVTGYVIESVAPPTEDCPDLRYDQFDYNQDGILDAGCFGLRYDACAGDVPDYGAFIAAGGVCRDSNCVPAGDLSTGAPACDD